MLYLDFPGHSHISFVRHEGCALTPAGYRTHSTSSAQPMEVVRKVGREIKLHYVVHLGKERLVDARLLFSHQFRRILTRHKTLI